MNANFLDGTFKFFGDTIFIPPPGDIVLGCVCLLVGWFVGRLWLVRSFVRLFLCSTLAVMSQKMLVRFFYKTASAPCVTFERSRLMVKVKTAMLKIFHLQYLGRGLRCFHQIWQSDRSNFGMKYNFRQNSIWRSGVGLHCLSFLSS